MQQFGQYEVATSHVVAIDMPTFVHAPLYLIARSLRKYKRPAFITPAKCTVWGIRSNSNFDKHSSLAGDIIEDQCVPVYDCSGIFSGWGKRDGWHFSADSTTASRFARLLGCIARVSRGMDWLRSYVFSNEFDREPLLWQEQALTLPQVEALQNTLHQRWQPNTPKEPARDPAVRPPGFKAFMPPIPVGLASADAAAGDREPPPTSEASPGEPAHPSGPPPPAKEAPQMGRPCAFTDVRLKASGSAGPWEAMEQPPAKQRPRRGRGSSRPPIAPPTEVPPPSSSALAPEGAHATGTLFDDEASNRAHEIRDAALMAIELVGFHHETGDRLMRENAPLSAVHMCSHRPSGQRSLHSFSVATSEIHVSRAPPSYSHVPRDDPELFNDFASRMGEERLSNGFPDGSWSWIRSDHMPAHLNVLVNAYDTSTNPVGLSKAITWWLRHCKDHQVRSLPRFEDSRVNIDDFTLKYLATPHWQQCAKLAGNIPNVSKGPAALAIIGIACGYQSKQRLEAFVWHDEVLAIRAQCGHKHDAWLPGRLRPLAMDWVLLLPDSPVLFLYHGTSRKAGEIIAREGLHCGRMFGYTGARYPWDRHTERCADRHDVPQYDQRANDDAIVIISVAVATEHGCKIWQTRSNAFLIDRPVPPQAIIAVDHRRGGGRNNPGAIRAITKEPPVGYKQGVTREQYWVHWDPEVLNRALHPDLVVVRNQNSEEALLAQAESSLDVRNLRTMSFKDVNAWLAGAQQSEELRLVHFLPDIGRSEERHPFVAGSIVGPISVRDEFGPLEMRILHGLLQEAGVGTNVATTALALKEVRAFWKCDSDREDPLDFRWLANLSEDDRALLTLAQGRQTIDQAVRRCFSALLGHLLGLLACLSASGYWHAIVGNWVSLQDRLDCVKEWDLPINEAAFISAARLVGGPSDACWGRGAGDAEAAQPLLPSSPPSGASTAPLPGDAYRPRALARSRTRAPKRAPRGDEPPDGAVETELPVLPPLPLDSPPLDSNASVTTASEIFILHSAVLDIPAGGVAPAETSEQRNVPDDALAPAAERLQQDDMLSELGALQGLLHRCRCCNAVFGPDTILCHECQTPTQGDLSPEDAEVVQRAAKALPEEMGQAIEKARRGAVEAAASSKAEAVGGLSAPPPAPPQGSSTATHVAGVRVEVGRSTKAVRSEQGALSGHWDKYHRRARNFYLEKFGAPHPHPKFPYIAWLYDTDRVWANRMDTRDHERGVPELNWATITAYYRNDMYCCFPHDESWHGKPMTQPHSGIRVPKRALAEYQQTVRVSGGDAVTEIRPFQQEGMRAVVQRHNLALGSKGQGKRGFVDMHRGTAEAQPIAPSPASTWNDPRGSWGSPSSPAPPSRGNEVPAAQAAPADTPAPPSNYTQGGSSGSADGWVPPGAAVAPAVVPDFVCPLCNTSTPRDRPGYNYCAHCQGLPWQCWNWWCRIWNHPQQFPCRACGRTERSRRATGEWGASSRSKRRR